MKRKIILAVAVMLVLVMALSSCGVSGNKIENILNADYDISADVYGEATNVSELDGYTVDNSQSNSYFLIFTKADLENDAVTTKVFSLDAGKVVYTCTTNETNVYALETYRNVPAFRVTSISILADGSDADPSYTIYDATGASVVTTSYAPDAPYMVGDELVVYNYAGYTVDDEGKLEKKMDIPEYLGIRDIDAVTDEYYYVFGGDDNDEGVIVYDLEFNVVSTWMVPTYAEEVSMFVLNNGDIFSQYVYVLDEDATDFDIYDEDGKYDLVTRVINAKNGKAKEVKMDYIVENVSANRDLYDADEDNNRYTDKFDNLALVYPIVNKNVDYSDQAMEIVLLNNNGKIKSALNYVEDLTSFGTKVADDLYAVKTVAAVVLINGNGKVVKTLNKNNLDFVGEYIIGDVAIYDMDFEIVYNLLENKATVDGILGDTVFVKAETDKGYEIISFNGGEQKTVLTYNEDNLSNDEFGVINNIAYYIINGASGEYTYYNANGDVMIKTTSALNVVAANEDIVVFSSDVDGLTKYYVASVVDAD